MSTSLVTPQWDVRVLRVLRAVGAVGAVGAAYLLGAEQVARRAMRLGWACSADCSIAPSDWPVVVPLIAAAVLAGALAWAGTMLVLDPSAARSARSAAGVGGVLSGLLLLGLTAALPWSVEARAAFGLVGLALLAVSAEAGVRGVTALHRAIVDLPRPARIALVTSAVVVATWRVVLAQGDCRLGTCAAALPWRNSFLLTSTAIVASASALVAAAGPRWSVAKTVSAAVGCAAVYVPLQLFAAGGL